MCAIGWLTNPLVFRGGGGLQIISLLEMFDSSKRGKKEGEKILSLLDPVRREKEEGRWNK